MKVQVTYDDTLYQLVPKMLQLNLKGFLAIANKHPDIVGAPVYYAAYPAPDESLSAAPTPPAQPEQSLRIEISDEELKRLTELPPGFHNCTFSNEPVQTAVFIASESAQTPAQPPIPESLWRSILDAGLTLHKEGDEWWVGKAQPAERIPDGSILIQAGMVYFGKGEFKPEVSRLAGSIAMILSQS